MLRFIKNAALLATVVAAGAQAATYVCQSPPFNLNTRIAPTGSFFESTQAQPDHVGAGCDASGVVQFAYTQTSGTLLVVSSSFSGTSSVPGGLNISGVPFLLAATRPPINLTIADSVFDAHTSLVIFDSLPPMSVLIVSGNAFNGGRIMTNAVPSHCFIWVSTGWDTPTQAAYGLPVTAGDGTVLTITKNTMQPPTGGVNASAAIALGWITLSLNGTLFEISDNTITTAGTATGITALNYGVNTVFLKNSTFSIRRNQIDAGVGGGSGMPLQMYGVVSYPLAYNPTNVAIGMQNRMIISDNTFTSTGAVQYFSYHFGTNNGPMAVLINNNTFTANGQWDNSLNQIDQATTVVINFPTQNAWPMNMSFSFNTMTANPYRPMVAMYDIYFTVEGSALIANNNTFNQLGTQPSLSYSGGYFFLIGLKQLTNSHVFCVNSSFNYATTPAVLKPGHMIVRGLDEATPIGNSYVLFDNLFQNGQRVTNLQGFNSAVAVLMTNPNFFAYAMFCHCVGWETTGVCGGELILDFALSNVMRNTCDIKAQADGFMSMLSSF